MESVKQHAGWCRTLFDRLNEGGVWAVPRSGVIFQKRGNEFVLIQKMPHMAEMPITPEQLAEQQESEFQTVRKHFAEAGIPVVKNKS
jgi:hypothetical protein